MEIPNEKLLANARKETLPDIPAKIRRKAKIFGKRMISDYIGNYYKRESEGRIPFYLPYIYMRENFSYLRRYVRLPKSRILLVLIDGGDERTDYFLEAFLGELNFLTIVTERKKYFESLQERAFRELGLIIELVYPWETGRIQGNMVWDFTKNIQCTGCYPKGSICFVPHKKEWKLKELLKTCEDLTVVSLKYVKIGELCISPSMAETLLVPADFPFRKSRLEDLQSWCGKQKWSIKMRARSIEKS